MLNEINKHSVLLCSVQSDALFVMFYYAAPTAFLTKAINTAYLQIKVQVFFCLFFLFFKIKVAQNVFKMSIFDISLQYTLLTPWNLILMKLIVLSNLDIATYYITLPSAFTQGAEKWGNFTLTPRVALSKPSILQTCVFYLVGDLV